MNRSCARCGASLTNEGKCPICPAGEASPVPPILPPASRPYTVAPPVQLHQASQPASAELTIRFRPVAMLVGQFTILINGNEVHASSFSQGFELKFTLPLGVHEVQTRIDLLGIHRNQSTRVQIGPRGATAELQYSRLWGNFQASKVYSH